MKFKVILLLLLFANTSVFSQNLSVESVRERYENALTSEEIAEKLYNDLENYKGSNTVILAYKAGITGMMCIYYKSPFKRLSLAKDSANYIDDAVERSPNNLEVRFVRFALQTEMPKILGHSKNINEDKSFLAANFKKSNFGSIPFKTLEGMIHLMDESGEFSTKEITKLKSELY